MSRRVTFRRELMLLVFLLGCSILATYYVFWTFELGNGEVEGAYDIIWWWVVTSATVGYGDIVPGSAAGRAVAVFVILVGVYAYTHVVSLILRTVQYNFEKEVLGYAPVESRGHLLVCEYTAFADELIQEIKERDLFADRDIVIVGSLIDRTPYPEYEFVHGEPISPDTLRRANVSQAELIFVFSNNRFLDPDSKTLHVASRIMEINDHARIVVELNDKNCDLLRYLPRDVIIMETDDLLSSALSHKYIELDRYLKEDKNDL